MKNKNSSMILSLFFSLLLFFGQNLAVILPKLCVFAENNGADLCYLAIIIDDFGGYDRGGVEEMLQISVPLTCAVIPFSDNTKIDADRCVKAGHEVILHMPMESHVLLPETWYGPVFITNNENDNAAKNKLDKCLEELPMAKGANIHIGSGVSQNKELMKTIIGHLKSKDKYFCDSRTILNTKCEEASQDLGLPYLGRDVFLEPHGEKSYSSACKYLMLAGQKAKERGYAIAIGHVGVEGGIQTAQAIKNMVPELRKMGVTIVPLSKINNLISK